MRTIIYAFLVACVQLCNGQFTEIKKDSVTGTISFSEVVIKDSSIGKETYLLAKDWFVMTFKSANDVIQLDDKEQGKIIGKGLTHVYIETIVGAVKTKMFFTLSVHAKDGRYRYEFTNISFQGYPSQYALNPPVVTAEESDICDNDLGVGMQKKQRQKYHDECLKEINNMAQSLKASLAAKKVKEDW